MPEITVHLTNQQTKVLYDLSAKLDLSQEKVLLQGLAITQLLDSGKANLLPLHPGPGCGPLE